MLCQELQNHVIVSKSVPPHEPIPCPQEYGFCDLYRQCEQLVDAVEKSRDTFTILMSWVTFLLLCLEPTLGKEQPAWLNHVSSLSIDNNFIMLLWQSELWVGWDRVGLLFNNSCQYSHHAKFFMEARIPMWLLWGKHKPSEWPNSLFVYLQPTNQEINIAQHTPCNPKTPHPSLSFTLTWGTSLTAPSSSNSWGDSAWGEGAGGSWGLAESSLLSSATWGTSSTTLPSSNLWGDLAWGKVTGGSWGPAESSSLLATWGMSLTAPSLSNSWGEVTGGSWGLAESSSLSSATWGTSSTTPSSSNSWGDLAWGKVTGGG